MRAVILVLLDGYRGRRRGAATAGMAFVIVPHEEADDGDGHQNRAQQKPDKGVAATIAGIDVTGVRLPVQFFFTPATGRMEAKIQESTVQAAHGRIHGNASLVWDRDLAVSGKAQLHDLRLGSLVRSAGAIGVSSGRISGTTEFWSD